MGIKETKEYMAEITEKYKKQEKELFMRKLLDPEYQEILRNNGWSHIFDKGENKNDKGYL